MSDVDIYKYDYPEKLPWNGKNFILIGLSLVLLWLGLTIAINYNFAIAIPVAFFLIVMLNRSWEKKAIEITSRYLICGSHLVYFQNVQSLTVDQASGEIRLLYSNGKQDRQLVIQRDKFPTNARKDHKIAANKEQKFQKMADKITRAVGRWHPELVRSI